MLIRLLGRLGRGLSLSILLFAPLAGAVSQPGGPVIPVSYNSNPCTQGDIQSCLDLSEGTPDLIDAVGDALVAPETFKPTCALTFKPFIKGGGNALAFGWYNVKPDPENPGQYLEPDETERFGMMRLNPATYVWGDPVFVPVTLDLALEAEAGRYTGGEIGFFLVGNNATAPDPVTHLMPLSGGQTFFYTQHSLNPGAAGPWYQVLTWQSVAFENAFYFGWEDLVASDSSDNDFEDLAFLVTGIQCSGGGEPCDTGKIGVCALGTQQCTKGELSCVQTIPESDETCNALDDDCNGEVDEGDLCDVNEVCDRGVCVPKCGGGEFRNCPDQGYTCSRGLCMEENCVDVECDAGKACHDGECVDACQDVVCPYGRLCRNGGCVDPCAGITCDDGFACLEGICQSCECTSCGTGQVCQANLCVAEACLDMTCDVGAHCADDGTCVADCDGVSCPAGQICMGSDCVPDPNAVMGDGGEPSIVLPDDIGGDSGGAAAAGGAKNPGSGNSGSVERPFNDDNPGCVCAISPGKKSSLGSSRGYSAFALSLLGVALALGRRRRVRPEI